MLKYNLFISAHANLDEHVAHWFGLNQSKYQWALEDYYENNEKVIVLFNILVSFFGKSGVINLI